MISFDNDFDGLLHDQSFNDQRKVHHQSFNDHRIFDRVTAPLISCASTFHEGHLRD